MSSKRVQLVFYPIKKSERIENAVLKEDVEELQRLLVKNKGILLISNHFLKKNYSEYTDEKFMRYSHIQNGYFVIRSDQRHKRRRIKFSFGITRSEDEWTEENENLGNFFVRMACRNGLSKSLRVLLENGASPNSGLETDVSRTSVLYLSCSLGHNECVEILCSHPKIRYLRGMSVKVETLSLHGVNQIIGKNVAPYEVTQDPDIRRIFHMRCPYYRSKRRIHYSIQFGSTTKNIIHTLEFDVEGQTISSLKKLVVEDAVRKNREYILEMDCRLWMTYHRSPFYLFNSEYRGNPGLEITEFEKELLEHSINDMYFILESKVILEGGVGRYPFEGFVERTYYDDRDYFIRMEGLTCNEEIIKQVSIEKMKLQEFRRVVEPYEYSKERISFMLDEVVETFVFKFFERGQVSVPKFLLL